MKMKTLFLITVCVLKLYDVRSLSQDVTKVFNKLPANQEELLGSIDQWCSEHDKCNIYTYYISQSKHVVCLSVNYGWQWNNVGSHRFIIFFLLFYKAKVLWIFVKFATKTQLFNVIITLLEECLIVLLVMFPILRAGCIGCILKIEIELN